MTDRQALTHILAALAAAAPSREGEFAQVNAQTLLKSLQLDSLATMEMVSTLEKRLGRTLDEAELVKVKAVGQLVRVVQGVPI